MSGTFVISSEANPDLVLDIEGGKKDKGAKLIIWKHHGNTNQQFKISPDGFITSAHSGLVLDVEGGVKKGANIIQWPAHGGPNQKWYFHKDGTIRLEGSNLVLDINGGKIEQGTNVIAWDSHGGINQKWRVVNKWN
jgi:hypothetical protein